MGPITICSSFDKHSIVFRGRVLEVIPQPSPGTPVTYPDGSKDTLHAVPMTEDFRFEVLEVFKGNPGSEITVRGGNGEFRQGQEFIVFASSNPTAQAIETSVCSGNRGLGNPGWDSDLAWLRAYPTAPPTARIFGEVTMGYGIKDIPPVTVKTSGEKTLTASTGDDHSYAFENLPPGTYTLTAVLPAGYTTHAAGAVTVTVEAKGCTEVDWGIRHDTHVKGSVTDTAGIPAPNVHIGLLRPAHNRTGFDIVASQRTDVNGNYDFNKVDPGDYWVALNYLGPSNNEPYVPVYYPSAANQSTAELIHLGPMDVRENVNLVLIPALHPVSLHVRVINQDGTPVVKARVAATDPMTPTQFIGATADQNGDAAITLYAGREYSVIASTSGYREPACAGPVKFIAKEDLQLGTLTLDKTWNECRALQRAP
jgi:protocatechuate 3,4-dioxygenase beta subunit